MSELIPVAEMSKKVLGRIQRLAILKTIADYRIEPPEPFRGLDLQERLGEGAHPGEIGKELRLLVDYIGAVQPMPELNDGHSKYYRRVDSPLWPLVEDLVARTIELSPAFTLEAGDS